MDQEDTEGLSPDAGNEAVTDSRVRDVLSQVSDLMGAFRTLYQQEPMFKVGSLNQFEDSLEGFGQEIAARWRYHQDTGGW